MQFRKLEEIADSQSVRTAATRSYRIISSDAPPTIQPQGLATLSHTQNLLMTPLRSVFYMSLIMPASPP